MFEAVEPFEDTTNFITTTWKRIVELFFETNGEIHENEFFNYGIKISSLDIKLYYKQAFNANNGQNNANALRPSNGGESFDVMYSMSLNEILSNNLSFEMFNGAIRFHFDLKLSLFFIIVQMGGSVSKNHVSFFKGDSIFSIIVCCHSILCSKLMT